MSLRDEALVAWGTEFSLRRFHEAFLALGAPPLGTMGDALLTEPSPFPWAGRRIRRAPGVAVPTTFRTFRVLSPFMTPPVGQLESS